MINESLTYKELLKKDLKYIKNVFKENIDNLIYDEEWESYLLWGEKPLDEWFFEDGDTILNPKDLTGYMNEMIDNLKKGDSL